MKNWVKADFKTKLLDFSRRNSKINKKMCVKQQMTFVFISKMLYV